MIHVFADRFECATAQYYAERNTVENGTHITIKEGKTIDLLLPTIRMHFFGTSKLYVEKGWR